MSPARPGGEPQTPLRRVTLVIQREVYIMLPVRTARDARATARWLYASHPDVFYPSKPERITAARTEAYDEEARS